MKHMPSGLVSFGRLPKPMLESQMKMHIDNVTQREASQPHNVSVRSLVEFVLQSGDLTSGGFQRRDRAQLGTLGYKQVQRSRHAGYKTEVEIVYQVEGADPPMEVRGRIDGLYASEVPVIIARRLHMLAGQLAGLPHSIPAQLFIIHSGNFDMNVNPVKEGA